MASPSLSLAILTLHSQEPSSSAMTPPQLFCLVLGNMPSMFPPWKLGACHTCFWKPFFHIASCCAFCSNVTYFDTFLSIKHQVLSRSSFPFIFCSICTNLTCVCLFIRFVSPISSSQTGSHKNEDFVLPITVSFCISQLPSD